MLLVIFGKVEARKTIKMQLLVINHKSIYKCIIGKPYLVELCVVSSTIHLKMRYYTTNDKVATIEVYIITCKTYFLAPMKNHKLQTRLKVNDKADNYKKAKEKLKTSADEVNMVDFDV